MKMTFRWYGENDPVTIKNIRQIPGMSGIVSAVYDVPVGEVWPNESIERIKKIANTNDLQFEVVESVPVHEDIKLGRDSRDLLIANYCENIRRLAKAGIKVIIYNFMPVFDWFRSDLSRKREDGSYTLAFDNQIVNQLNPLAADISLPGWDESYTKAELRELLTAYKQTDEEKLWDNFTYFINKVVPVCEAVGVNLAIHPDDPPWSIFDLPRIITGAKSYERLVQINPSKTNGITLCLGSLGADPACDLVEIAKRHADRIHFVHARNIIRTGEKSFEEAPHPTAAGDLDMYAILKSLFENDFNGFIRPDHGRMIWEETGRAGYGLYDRALGATYLLGIWEGIERGGL